MSNKNLSLDELDGILKRLESQLDDLDSYDSLEMDSISDIEAFEDAYRQVQPKLDLKYHRVDETVKPPVYNYESDSGFDLYSTEEVGLLPFERKLISTGLFLDIPEGYEVQVRTKSGLAINQGLMVLNSPGTVDQGYTGEIKVILMNMNNISITVGKGQKIAQAVLSPVVCGKWINLIENKGINQKERGSNGFGSTGI